MGGVSVGWFFPVDCLEDVGHPRAIPAPRSRRDTRTAQLLDETAGTLRCQRF